MTHALPPAVWYNPELYQDMSGNMVYAFPTLIPLALVGFFVGYIAGMFGVGGGFLLTPVLNIFFNVPMPLAVSSALCQQSGTTITSYLKFRRYKLGEGKIGLVMVGGALMGVDAGARLLNYLKELGTLPIANNPPAATVVLEILYAIILSITIILTLREALAAMKRKTPRGDKTIPGPLAKIRIPPYIDLPRVDLYQVSVPVLAYVGFLVGLLSGLMGIGGGVAFVPILIYGYGLSIRNTAGSSLLLLFGIVVTGTIAHAWKDNMSLMLALAVLVGSSIGAQLGTISTYRLSNRKLRWGFIALLTATVGMIVVDLVRHLT